MNYLTIIEDDFKTHIKEDHNYWERHWNNKKRALLKQLATLYYNRNREENLKTVTMQSRLNNLSFRHH